MAKHKTPEQWSRIEFEYLSAEDSIREIADRHEISEAAIRKRAKSQGWERPEVKVRKLRTPSMPHWGSRPVGLVTADAATLADRGRGLIGRMLDELDATTSHIGELEEAICDATADDQSSRRQDAMLGAISLGSRAKTLKELATAFKTLNEAAAPQGKKAQQQEKAEKIANRFRGVGPPTLKAVK